MTFFAEIDLIPWFACFLPCILVGMQYGIMSGVAVDIILLLFGIARPKVVAQKRQVSNIQRNATRSLQLIGEESRSLSSCPLLFQEFFSNVAILLILRKSTMEKRERIT